ncbi:hypothetical protein Sste5346_004370 [Sporothrix stenoceras]|uniref:CBM-cenC domain-containing protein n=1 Tax=Sporothrix stenoceras TaxID=5173 RepID=A0ABR3Z7V0_9PEZI
MRTRSLFALGGIVLSGLPVTVASACRRGPHPSLSSSVSSTAPSASPSTSPSPPAACSNLVQNPDFSNGLTGWDQNSMSHGAYSVTPSTSCGTSAGDPASCAVFYAYTADIDPSFAATYQSNLPVTPGSIYTLYFRYRLVGNDAPSHMFTRINDVQSNGAVFNYNYPGGGPWAWFSTVWTAPTTPSTNFPDTTKAAITIILSTDGETTAWISDVKFDACVEIE